MHKKLTAVVLLVVVGLAACNRGQKTGASTGELTADEYDVISGYTAGLFSDQNRRDQLQGVTKIVILNTTSSGDDRPPFDENGQRIAWEKTVESLRKQAPALQQATADAFRKANAQQALVRRSFHIPIDYEVINSAQLEAAFKSHGGDWPGYYKQYPGAQGYATFSRVGFSADGTQALFYFGNRCGALCGGGFYVVMEKRNGHWVIEKEIQMWVS